MTFRLNKYQFWIFILIFSFGYELPIINIFSYDRFNPRLFDIAIIIGVFIINKNIKITKDEIFTKWVYLIFWFTLCTMFGYLIFDFNSSVKVYMLYYLFEYFKGLIIIILFLSIPVDKYNLNTLFIPLVFGGVFVSMYCIYEYVVGVDEVVINDDLTRYKPKELLWGPFIGSYFNIAVYLPLVTTITFSKMFYSGNKKILWGILFLFISWPIFFTGSRTAVILWLLPIVGIFLFNIKNKLTVIISVSALLIGLVLILSKPTLLDDNYTYQRFETSEAGQGTESDNSISGRLSYITKFNITAYDTSDYLPIIGGGFYVAPINGNARIGYGFHNIFIFPFEQSGLIGFILFIIFILAFHKKIKKYLNSFKHEQYYWFILAVFSYSVASLLIGWSGHTFWRGFGTNNFNTLRILLMIVMSCYVTRVFHKKDSL